MPMLTIMSVARVAPLDEMTGTTSKAGLVEASA